VKNKLISLVMLLMVAGVVGAVCDYPTCDPIECSSLFVYTPIIDRNWTSETNPYNYCSYALNTLNHQIPQDDLNVFTGSCIEWGVPGWTNNESQCVENIIYNDSTSVDIVCPSYSMYGRSILGTDCYIWYPVAGGQNFSNGTEELLNVFNFSNDFFAGTTTTTTTSSTTSTTTSSTTTTLPSTTTTLPTGGDSGYINYPVQASVTTQTTQPIQPITTKTLEQPPSGGGNNPITLILLALAGYTILHQPKKK
jgi:hypothetical protein